MDDITSFLHVFHQWVRTHDDVLAAALVGSWARGGARDDSDVDLVLIVADTDKFMNSDDWAAHFGAVTAIQDEAWGAIFRSKRVYYRDGREVEFGFTTLAWAATDPVDAGTRQVVTDGLRILYDNGGILQALALAVAEP